LFTRRKKKRDTYNAYSLVYTYLLFGFVIVVVVMMFCLYIAFSVA